MLERVDIEIKNEFKIKLTPKHDEPVYPQSLPIATNHKVKNEMLVELALSKNWV